MLNQLLKEKNLTKYRLSKDSGIPYSTINDICNGKARLEKCSAETIYRISRILDIPMEKILEPYLESRTSFELYKSNICHYVKEKGDIEFIIETLERNDIRTYYKKKWYPECFYLLAMLDYLSRINNIPHCTDYDDLRTCRLSEPIYPASVIASYAVSQNETIKKDAYDNSIPEFVRFNIVESEVRNVV